MEDVLVVGGGPAGMTLAHACAAEGLRVVLLEREDVLGGCHRVRRVDGAFTEHGPRMYFKAFVSFDRALKRAGLGGISKYFVKYAGTDGRDDKAPTARDSALLGLYLMWFLFTNQAPSGSVADWTNKIGASKETRAFLTSLCSRVEGATSQRFPFREFLQLGNQMALHFIKYQPSKPNDLGFVRDWQQALLNTGVRVFTGVDAVSIHPLDGGGYELRDILGETYRAKRIVFAIPPAHLVGIDGISGAFGDDLVELSKRTEYDTYVPVTFEWAEKQSEKRVIDLTTRSWGILAVELSATTDFGGKVVVSTCVTILDQKSPVTGLTANETVDPVDFAREVLRQVLETSTGYSASGVRMTVSPGATNAGSGWTSLDTAYIKTPGTRAIRAASEKMPGLYTIGSHNQMSPYEFTSIESAVANADALLFEWFQKSMYEPTQATTLRMAILYMVVICVSVFACVRFFRGRSK